MTQEEEFMIKKYRKAYREYQDVADEVGTYFMQLARKAITDGNLGEARSIMHRCPDDVTRAFIMDAINVHLGKYD